MDVDVEIKPGSHDRVRSRGNDVKDAKRSRDVDDVSSIDDDVIFVVWERTPELLVDVEDIGGDDFTVLVVEVLEHLR